MNEGSKQHIASIIEKIQVFRGFSMNEARQLLRMCRARKYAKGETVYEAGDESTEMFIMLQGELQVIGQEGIVLAEISPGSSVGEMGILTGNPRSATVIATQDVSGVLITRKQLATLMMADQDVRVRILENIVMLLCNRLLHANVQIEHYAD